MSSAIILILAYGFYSASPLSNFSPFFCPCKEAYVSSTKRQKMAISRSIVEAIRALEPPGRFLEKDRVTVMWTEIGYKKAIEKTSQALRDGAANLRKQLSADFGDPNFLNAVFDDKENVDKCDSVASSGDSVTVVGETGGATESDSSLQTTMPDTFLAAEEFKSSTGTESRGDDMKLDSVVSEKMIAVTKKVSPKVRIMLPPYIRSRRITIFENLTYSTQTSQNPANKALPIKRGLRRSRSNPCLAASSFKSFRKVKQMHGEKYSVVACSPRTPRSKQSTSQPSSPMTWGGNRQENMESGSFGPVPAYSTHNHPLSPASYDYYSYEKGYYPQVYEQAYDPRLFGRSYSYDQYMDYRDETRHDYHPSTSKSHGPSSLHQPPALSVRYATGASSFPWGYHSGTDDSQSSGHMPPKHPSSRSPTSPLPRGALPPGRHQFSPAGYRSDPPEHEYSQIYEEYHGNSPRYPQETKSPVHVERSPHWKSPYAPYGVPFNSSPAPPGYAMSFTESVNTTRSSSLSVPSLGVENRSYDSVDVRMLSPRSRSSCGDNPPRRPATARDFAPPASKSRHRIVRRRGTCTHPWEEIAGDRSNVQTSTISEEKKIDNEAVIDFHGDMTPLPCKSASPTTLEDTQTSAYFPTRKAENNNADTESLEDCMAMDCSGRFERSTGKTDSVRSSPALTLRSSPLLARISIVATDGEDAEHVEDIEMSPMSQAYHEDPSTLMELPENLMSLPISPCGPHDYPQE